MCLAPTLYLLARAVELSGELRISRTWRSVSLAVPLVSPLVDMPLIRPRILGSLLNQYGLLGSVLDAVEAQIHVT